MIMIGRKEHRTPFYIFVVPKAVIHAGVVLRVQHELKRVSFPRKVNYDFGKS
jgi:hypothetical protein